MKIWYNLGMSKKVDHNERKREIAEKAVRLFSKVGYDNVSLIMIAAATGISRPVLYRYFCDKREILDAAILTVTEGIEAKCTRIITGRGTVAEKLEEVCHTVAEVMFENKEFLVTVFDFVVGMVRSGANMTSNIHEFTRGTREALNRLIEYGILRGELPDVLKVDRTADAIYAEFESCALRIVVGTESNAKAAKQRFSDIVRAICSWK